jgi:2,4-dienoyl-CoA reductase-like NADH-dependent reductase (Old Yellow Enzyme family)/thioredoxin reductase
MKLFEKATLGPLNLRNRIVMPPMATLFGNRDGTVSERLLAYYARRAQGGAGMIIVENTAVHPGGVNYPGTLEIHHEKFEAGLEKLASAIKGHGATAAIQLFHPGRQIQSKYAGNHPIAPSPLPCPVMGGNPRELDEDEIHDLVGCFVDSAVRAKEAGFDAVEIHGAHGYLVSQFLSPLSNKRTGGYGGDPRRRARFAVEIIEGIRERVGDTFPLILRISAEDKVPGGLTLEQTKEMMPFLKQGITALHVSAGCYPSMEWIVQPYLQPRGCLKELARALREEAGVPILTVGRINEPQLANSIIEEGTADFVSIGRALIADPDFPDKAKEDESLQVRPCIACNVCIEAVGTRQTRCAVNPRMGREHEPSAPVKSPRKVLVVGGGPAGMEAALTARGLGHEVELFEAGEVLGGQLIPAGVPGSKTEIRRLLDYYRSAVEQSVVSVRLNKRVDNRAIREFEPDSVILATGAEPCAPVTGVDDSETSIQAVQVLREGRELPGDVAVIGGGPVGLDVADYLVSKGSKVTVIEMKKRVGGALEWNVGKMRISALKEKGVKLLVKCKVDRIGSDGVVYIDSERVEHTVKVDFVVLATGSKPYNPLEGPVRDLGIEVTVVGDGKEVRGLAEAIAEGFEAAIRLRGKDEI